MSTVKSTDQDQKAKIQIKSKANILNVRSTNQKLGQQIKSETNILTAQKLDTKIKRQMIRSKVIRFEWVSTKVWTFGRLEFKSTKSFFKRIMINQYNASFLWISGWSYSFYVLKHVDHIKVEKL